MTVIAMTQDVGCDIGAPAAIARSLGLNLTHQQQLDRRVAERMQVDVGVVQRVIAGNASLFDRWKGTGQRQLWRHMAKELLTLAAQDDELILAHWAIAVLRPIDHVICVHLCSPSRGGVPLSRISGTVSEERPACSSKVRRRDCRFTPLRPPQSGGREGPEDCDLALNMERIPVAECVEHVARLARCPQFGPTAASRAVLMDLLYAADKSCSQAGPTAESIAPLSSVRVGSHQLKLAGETSREQAIAIVEEHLRGKDNHSARSCPLSPSDLLHP